MAGEIETNFSIDAERLMELATALGGMDFRKFALSYEDMFEQKKPSKGERSKNGQKLKTIESLLHLRGGIGWREIMVPNPAVISGEFQITRDISGSLYYTEFYRQQTTNRGGRIDLNCPILDELLETLTNTPYEENTTRTET